MGLPNHASFQAALAALEGDDWAWFVQHAAMVAQRLDGHVAADRLAPLRGKPGQLAGGSGKARVVDLLADEPLVWRQFADIVRDQAPSRAITELFGRWQVALVDLTTRPSAGIDLPVRDAESDHTQAQQRLRSRVKQAREQRDTAVRQLAGAQTRASQAESQLQQAQDQIDQLQHNLAVLGTQRDDLARQLERASDREARRAAGEHQRLRDELKQLRRELDECKQQLRRETQQRQRPTELDRRGSAAGSVASSTSRVVPGRPTTLPDDLDLRSREAGELLFNSGRLVLVDGYNVTKQHHVSGDLEQQRRWLVDVSTRVVQRHQIRCQIVFDGQHPSGSRPRGHRADVQVSFTAAGFTADDEIVLRVEATDEPVVVVTDDRDLSDRVRSSGADVLPTGPFVWLGSSS